MRVREMQAINRDRANRWHGDFRNWSGLEWAGAMNGEAGEAANVTKKLKRIEDNLEGNSYSDNVVTERDALVEKLGNECADTFLYLLLLAARYEIDLQAAVVRRFNEKSIEMGFPERLTAEGDEEGLLADRLLLNKLERCVLAANHDIGIAQDFDSESVPESFITIGRGDEVVWEKGPTLRAAIAALRDVAVHAEEARG